MHISGALMFALTLGIVAIKILWVATEPRPLKDRFSKEMIKTNLIEVIILELQLISAIFFPFPAFGFERYVTIIGVILYVLGMLLALWGRSVMKQSWGFPTELEKKRQNSLATSGPFAFSRNPIYVGFILLYVGYALAIRSWFIILRIPMVIFFYRSILKEEKNLEEHFGQEYRNYKKRVPRFILF